MDRIHLKPVDKVEITVLVDNITDLLLGDSETVKRMRVMPPAVPLAEHGLSYLITVSQGDRRHTLLMDAGASSDCLMHNARLLPNSLWAMQGAVTHRLEDVQDMVLSHGHYDHFGGLPSCLASLGKSTPLVVHPGAFVQRRRRLAPDFYVDMPSLSESMLTEAGALIDKRATASTLAGDLIIVSGRVSRKTDFETGSPVMEAHIGGQWQVDSFEDDQSIAVHLKGKGLVVIGGCCHAGIINTVEHMRRVTGVQDVHAVMGGFHLSGAPEDLIAKTVSAMKEIHPDLIVPMHCTGWQAMTAFAEAMPGRFVLNSAGTTYLMAAE